MVHEATHARLEDWGFQYDEELRPRIESICSRRELAFAVKLPDSAQLQEEIAASLEFYEINGEYYSDANFEERYTQSAIEVLRHLGAPDWVAPTVLTMRSMRTGILSAVSRVVSFCKEKTFGGKEQALK